MSTISGRPGRLPPASGEGFWEPGPAADATLSSGLGGGGARACSVLASGAALCSGSDASAGTLPRDLFGYGLAVGDSHACALRRPDHTAVCWTLGGPTTTLYEPALGISFGFLVAGGNFTCGVASSDFSVYCWSAGAVAAPVSLPRIRPGVCVSDDSSFLLQRSFSSVIDGTAYVGFSSATGILFCRHYVLGWSFRMNGAAPPLNVSSLPTLPVTGPRPRSRALEIVLSIASAALVFAAAAAVFAFLRRRRMYAEVREDWEASFGPHRFSYKDLFHATDGFSYKRLLGISGFGRPRQVPLRLEQDRAELGAEVSHHQGRRVRPVYLHEDWEQVVVHRDIKASNVLLDKEMNARLGDFGLARLYDLGVLELVDVVVYPSFLEPVKETILRVHSVKCCIDCPNRTNVAQYAYGLSAFGRQLHAMGLTDASEIHPDRHLGSHPQAYLATTRLELRRTSKEKISFGRFEVYELAVFF
ncbi:L-type lectin-domain containing receptor kinase IV.2 [Zea mays]|uniref:L-type lectin-domain containing receptor kinase IV.2 n=1 Tax=Zea mays TaxID=4577 RepID=A0A3L6EZ57_MAIZE|nr:L-type lectin-domain containing receptor kinase IV.2 [Zea mays]